jgi:FMN phosphatase YigB (HAD superfamily)
LLLESSGTIMKNYYMFDCMETIIDINGWESAETDALWSYEKSGVEKYWNGFDDFLNCYMNSKSEIDNSLPKNKEYQLEERFINMISVFQIPEEEKQFIVKSLNNRLWETYKSHCYVNKDVMDVLPELCKKAKLSIVSNFKILNGIEELLEKYNLSKYFSNITTSVKSGWRKPNENI